MNDLAPILSVYDCAATCELYRQRVRHELFGTFCLKLQSFQTALGDAGGDGYWRPILQYLCRFRYSASATPLAFDDSAHFSPQACSSLEGALTSQGQYLYPDLAAKALDLFRLHRDVVATNTNPLLNAILERLTEASVVLVRETRLIAQTLVKITTSFHPSARVVGPQYLKGLTCVDHLVVVGPARWYPEYVFTAPRAKRIDLLYFSWMRDKRIDPISFIASPVETKHRPFPQYQDDNEAMIDADAILPAIDWKQIVQTARCSADQDQDEVDARLFSLDGDLAVFLEADEQATVRIIDPNSDEQPVQRMSVTELTTGVFVLLRTSGGGDYIVPIANRILGANSEAVRAQQQHWKQELRKLVGMEGVTAVARKLRERGSRIASDMNLRNWMAERSIVQFFFNETKLIQQVSRYWLSGSRFENPVVDVGKRLLYLPQD